MSRKKRPTPRRAAGDRADAGRAGAIARLRERLQARSWPRLQMSLIVGIAGAGGLLTSILLQHAGLHSMTVRYPVAVFGAWGVFLAMLGLWMRVQVGPRSEVSGTGGSTDLGGLGNLADLGDLVHDAASGLTRVRPGGGQFGGGGASASFADLGDAVGDTLGSVADSDDLAIPLLAIALAAGMALASLYLVYMAPTLFAEILLDSTLSYGLYRRLRAAEPHEWLQTAFRRTIVPCLLTALFLGLVGAGLSAHAPGARTIGQALHPVQAAD
jgi:hypothetical protein